MIAEPMRNERIDCTRLSGSSWWTTLVPIQRANAILPRTPAISSAHITNGTTAMPDDGHRQQQADGPGEQHDQQAGHEGRQRRGAQRGRSPP